MSVQNGSVHAMQQNGISTNGGYSANRRGRQYNSNGYNGRSQQYNSTYSNAQASKSTTNPKEDALNKRKLIEKEVKNLAKHDASVERVGRLFNEEIGKSQDRLRRAFEEMRHYLNEREKLMMEELEQCKTEGIQLLERGEQRAKDLRAESERAPSMSDRQVNDLRDQIRRFLAERRFEDELSRTIRFQFEPDRLIDMIKNFGEVIPIGCPQKRISQTSLVSSLDDDGSNAGNYNAKPVNEISSGGICMKSDSMTTEQLAQLTLHLKESLKLQGITEDILPDVAGVAGNMPARRRPPPIRSDNFNGHNNQHYNGRGRGGGGGGGRRGGRANGAETTRY